MTMHIAFYAPFKPLGHAHPSGDLVIATGLVDYLESRGHRMTVVSGFRSRWIYWTPWRWPALLAAGKRAARRMSQSRFDIWLSYHAYYKAPDLLGPAIAARTKLPYIIFQGSYATKRSKRLSTRPGYCLNKKSLCAAQHVFTNKRVDLLNLGRLLSPRRISYVAPGIDTGEFSFDLEARAALRREWNAGDDPVVLSAAMFRPGIKTEGLSQVIRACGRLYRQGRRLRLVIAGDGKQRSKLSRLAAEHLPGRVIFLGRVPREKMNRFYSAGDVFVFPGIRESLGMVFLEAQSCGLPVVAYENGGIPEVVRNGQTGLLVPILDSGRFLSSVEKLLADAELRQQMSRAARTYVRENHDRDTNYRKIEAVLEEIVR